MSIKHFMIGVVSGLYGLALTACSTPQVRTDYDERINLEHYHSYVWEQGPPLDNSGDHAFDNPLNTLRLREAVDQQLAAHHLELAVGGTSADAYIKLSIGTRQVLQRDDRFPVGVGFGVGAWSPGVASSLYLSNDGRYGYREGRITIDIYDALTRKPIWHATVEQDLSYLTGQQAQQRINEVVQAIFNKFPTAVSK